MSLRRIKTQRDRLSNQRSTSTAPQSVEEALRNVYYDAAQVGSYGGVEPLVRAVHRILGGAHSLKYIRARARNWLKSQDAYTLHKPLRRRITRCRTLVYGIDEQWQADLVDMREWQRENEGYNYLLTCIDIFSKYAWVRPIKTKSGEAVNEAFADIFAVGNRIPTKLQTDKGKEFLNRRVQTLFKNYGVKHFYTENETKAAVVERFNRTLKSKMWRYFTESGNHRYIDALENLVEVYNNTKHRTTGYPPINVTAEKEGEIWHRMYKPFVAATHNFKFAVAEQVRLSKFKWPFEKGYMSNWTDEVFLVAKRWKKVNRCLYKVVDMTGEEVSGSFYEEELQAVDKRLSEDTFEIERILERRRHSDGSVKEVLVKWKGWPDKFNSWVPIPSDDNNEGEVDY
jgi:transposase InsO family protein